LGETEAQIFHGGVGVGKGERFYVHERSPCT